MNTLYSTYQMVPDSSSRSTQTLEKIQRSMGMVPNIFKVMAQSPNVLEGYMNFSGQLQKGLLSAQDRERIALMLAGFNHCEYCASAHSLIGSKVGLAAEEVHSALKMKSKDPKSQALLNFCLAVVEHKGFVPAEQMEAIHAAGYTDEAIVEIVANIALSIFTNYFNHVAGTQNDFPKVDL